MNRHRNHLEKKRSNIELRFFIPYKLTLLPINWAKIENTRSILDGWLLTACTVYLKHVPNIPSLLHGNEHTTITVRLY